jgi:hypothetical protein
VLLLALQGFYVFIRALQLLRSHNEGVVLVGLGGASGSGKTAFSEKVKDFMPGIALISMDNYNDASKVVDSNFDGEEWLTLPFAQSQSNTSFYIGPYCRGFIIANQHPMPG